jgi:Ala-tRNA(Pro) deacylase
LPDPEGIQRAMLAFLHQHSIEHRLYHHRPVLNYDDAELARQESGFDGTEGKVLICQTGDTFAVFVTLQGRRLDMNAVRQILGRKVHLANTGDLQHHFAATPGSAYPFGFDVSIPILVDPAIYNEALLLYSMPIVTTTLQISGSEMRRIMAVVENPVMQGTPWFMQGVRTT